MIQDHAIEPVRVNARRTDVFDIFNFKNYVGPNPYLETGALVFDFALTDNREALPLEDYVKGVSERYPELGDEEYSDYAHLFARTASEVAKLDMDLHLNRWSVKEDEHHHKIAIQSLYARTTRGVIYFVWDWFEAITQGNDVVFDEQLTTLQNRFRSSVYGGPTVYALLRTAHKKGIPAFYLWEEGLMQYGFGKKHVRGIATTFDGDSHLDSDFTTRKDDCKAFLKTLGFPVPQGDIIASQREALSVAREIGYPVAIKPVVGHKGIGVTADVQGPKELEAAYERAFKAIPEDQSTRIIVEKSIKGSDFRILCVNGRFVAAIERRPASVIGDGYSTIDELIQKENQKPVRRDTPTSPMSKIQCDEAMELYLEEQELSLISVIEKGKRVFLRKVANLSAGGVSIDATHTMHPDNIILAQDIAQHFRLTCLGIDVISENLGNSWKEGNFAILEINSAPGVMMHLNPAVGDSVDVPSYILETFFSSGDDARIPIITFNKISIHDLQETIDHILSQHPDWTVGAVCQDAVFVNRSRKVSNSEYNTNVQSLVRNPKLDLLIVEYNEEILERDGMFYYGSNMVVLDNPTDTEMMLSRDMLDGSTLVIKKGDSIMLHRKGLIEEYSLGEDEPFTRVYLKEIGTIV
ncbi:RimK domain-containing protein ATP-grasp [Calothrix sp. NIES-4071]|nr:RimK domain-containing protein ATP-grasp [Calothrix sp. NIES-4071]BAZ58243.1 RimK domain-containing protein ATP-grasp [Calothrix sp. NIES-4105]